MTTPTDGRLIILNSKLLNTLAAPNQKNIK